jgi:pyruvate/2-oxoglutarate dehydrogenase complex dihydrolipoamide dehydrogenase (E3) component
MARHEYNLVVVGGGSAGLIAAYIAATVRARVALVEAERMGGDCLNTGCVPSKTFLSSARVAHTLRTADRFGIDAVVPAVRFEGVMDRVRAAIRTIEPKDSAARYTALGVECIAGRARLLDAHRVAVGDRILTTRAIVIATGARPAIPPIPGLAEAEPLTSDTVWDLTALPRRLLVLGGGPVGCELAQGFARLGASVILADLEPRLLPREDADAGAHIATVFEREGIEVRPGHRIVRVAGTGPTGAGVALAEGPAGTVEIAFDRVLVAAGRRPSTGNLGLDQAGVQCTAAGAIRVDRYLRTTARSVFACGDVVGPWQFTHMAAHQAWYATVNALFGWIRKFPVNERVVPWATYTDPEVARVGLSEADAARAGVRVEVTRFELAELDRAITEGVSEGWVKVLTPPGRDRILGATVVGPHAGESIAEFVLAMTHGIGLKRLMSTIHIYPTFSEVAKLAAGAWRRAHAPERLLRWVGALHALRR